MEYMTLALDHDQSHLLKKARLKVSEWLKFKSRESNILATVYLEFSDSEKLQELDHIYFVIPKNDFERIILPTPHEIKEGNEILKKRELSRKIDIKSKFIPPISVKGISICEGYMDPVLVKVDLEEFRVDDSKKHRFQFPFRFQNSFRKPSKSSSTSDFSWDWIYEASIHPYALRKDEFADIDQIKTDLELWVMLEPTMYEYVSDLNIRYTQPFDRMVILSKKIAEEYGRDFVHEGELCIRWFFPEFSESGLGAEIIISKKKSTMEREKEYINKISSDRDNFFFIVNKILSSSRISVDFEFISEQLEELEFKEFARFLEILFEITYNRDDKALSHFKEFLELLEKLQELKYGEYYFHLYRILNRMQTCEEVRDIIMPDIRKWLEEFKNEPEFINKGTIEIFNKIIELIDLIKQFYYYNIPEDKYKQKSKILVEITELKNIAERKLVNPEGYLIAEEVLLKWENLVKEEFEQFVGSPKLNVELKTEKLVNSEYIHIIFNITNISDVPLVILNARLLPSEQYDIFEKERRWTTRRKRLTRSDDRNERIFAPEFVISPKTYPRIQVQLEVNSSTEDGKKFSEIFNEEIELFQEDMEFIEIEQNPYIVGKPIKTQQMFFGRRDIFETVIGTIIGVSVNQAIVYGQYRIGKTSVLYQLLNRLKGKYIPVLAITHGLETDDSELLRFWSIQISNAIKKRKKRTPEVPNYERLSNQYKEFQKFIEEIMENLGEAKIIFMIDEYDLIDELIQRGEISVELFHLLDWMIKHNRIELIIAGRSPMETLKTKEWKRIARPFAQIKLGFLDVKNAKKLMTEPVDGYMKYDDSAVEKILRLTNCHPYLIQLCCHVLVQYHNVERKSILRYEDVENCIPDMVELGSPGLDAMTLSDSTPEEQIVLQVMATVLKEQTSISEQELVVRIREHYSHVEDRDIKNAIVSLEKKEIIRFVTEEMRRFKFVCELFRYWIYAKMEPLEKRFLSERL